MKLPTIITRRTHDIRKCWIRYDWLFAIFAV